MSRKAHARKGPRARGKAGSERGPGRGERLGSVVFMSHTFPPGVRPRGRSLALALAVAWLAGVPGCGRSGKVAAEGQIVEHAAGFALRVPDDWEVRTADEEIRLVSKQTVADGYPTIHVAAPPASELPVDFMEGRHFQWSGGDGAYDYERWANSLGNGFRLTVHLRAERISLVVHADLWDQRVRMDRRFFRRQVWPVVNSIEVFEPAGE